MSAPLIASTPDPRAQRVTPNYSGTPVLVDVEDEPRLSDYRDILLDHKWLIGGVLALALLIGLVYATLATPVYRAGLLIQIEDAAPERKSTLTEANGLFEVKTPATGELQVIGSRLVLEAVAQQADMRVSAQPRYLPVFGQWLSRGATDLSQPGLFGMGGWVSGTERIRVDRFNVPEDLEDGKPFTITARGGGRYTVHHPLLDAPVEGMVGQPLRQSVPGGVLDIQLRTLDGHPGAQFTVAVSSPLRATERLQQRLQLGEQGRQSNVIGVSLEDTDRERLVRVLNAIGEQYVQQNIARRSAEAEKTLAFLDSQLPMFRQQLQASENAYAKYRNKNGTVDFDEEAKVWLRRSSDLQDTLLELEQKRRKDEPFFTDQSTRMRTLDQQIADVQGQIDALNGRVASMPNIQRDALRLERDVRVNAALFQSMQNCALQMRLVKEGKISNVRLLDKAAVSKFPVKPQKMLVLAFAALIGLLLGPALAIAHARSRRGIHNPGEIEDFTGLNVYAAVPHSPELIRPRRSGGGAAPAPSALLADQHPNSRAVEALRSLRVGLKPTLAEASNNRILITGATPGIGKSFVAANLATVLAQSGKRVLLVIADLRKGTSNAGLGIPREGGLTELLAGKLTAREAVHANVRANLDVLGTGALPELPAELLESQAFADMLEMFSRQYDLVVIDTAPVLVAADAAAVAPGCGVVLLVARAGQSELGELGESIRRLTQAGAQINGVLLNGMNMHRRYHGGSGYRQASYRYANYKYVS